MEWLRLFPNPGPCRRRCRSLPFPPSRLRSRVVGTREGVRAAPDYARSMAVARNRAGSSPPPPSLRSGGRGATAGPPRRRRRRPDPALLGAPRSPTSRGWGPRRRGAPPRSGIDTDRATSWSTCRCATRPSTRRARPRRRACGAGEEVTVRVVLDAISVRPTRRRRPAAGARPASTTPRGGCSATWFNQEHLARILLPGRRAAAARPGGRRGAPRAWWSRPTRSSAGPGSEGLHTQGLVPVYPATEQMPRAAHARAGRPGPAPGPRRARSACPRGSGGGCGLPGAADALVAVHFPRSRREAPRWAAAAWCVEELAGAPARPGRRAPARRRARARRPALRRDRRALRAPARGAALHAHRRAAAGRRARSPATWPRARPDAAAAAGRGRIGQDARRRPRDLPGRRGRRPGRAAGAHRDARRAAPAHARRAAGARRPGAGAR